MVTSNHIHLLVLDAGGQNVIPDSIKLMAGRTAQEFNQRKNRKGAFWEDRYHATAVECDKHMILIWPDPTRMTMKLNDRQISFYNSLQMH
ncbi:MAG: transposase [Desulfobacteraceae bacterium]|jgi:hypothetical protein